MTKSRHTSMFISNRNTNYWGRLNVFPTFAKIPKAENFSQILYDWHLSHIKVSFQKCLLWVGCGSMDFTLGGWIPDAILPPGDDCCSAVSRVVGKSMSLWIWMPSPGPMWEMWLKLDGAEIIFDLRSWFLKRLLIYVLKHKETQNVFSEVK